MCLCLSVSELCLCLSVSELCRCMHVSDSPTVPVYLCTYDRLPLPLPQSPVYLCTYDPLPLSYSPQCTSVHMTPPPPSLPQSPVYLRTYFSYDPEEDDHTPCPEAGLKFERGNILHVVNQDDPNWWQAVKDGDKTKWAGIVPSKSFRER